MITQWLMGVFADLASWMVGLIPAWTPPGFVADLPGQLTTWLVDVNKLGFWFPLPVIGICAAAIIGAFLIHAGALLIRTVISLFTGGGGSI